MSDTSSCTDSLSTVKRLAVARALVADNPGEAVNQLRQIIKMDPHNAQAYRALGRALRSLGDATQAEEAEIAAVRATAFDPQMVEIADAMLANDLPTAEPLLRARLKSQPFDVAAIRLMAELAARIGRLKDSETLLSRALELAPAFGAARANLATVLYKQNRFEESLEQLNLVLQLEGDNPSHRNLKAAALGRIGGYDEAIELYAELVERYPDHAKLWMSYGHMLKTVGQLKNSIAAYRRALEIQPELGEVWWSLANLKTIRFNPADLAAMEKQLQLLPVDSEDEETLSHRLHLHFALGKAGEDKGDAALSFSNYVEGNRLRAEQLDYDSKDTSIQVDQAIATFTEGFFEGRNGCGDQSPDPIFILGMPRAGSTLIEQILASHSAIEGTMELPDIPAMALGAGREFGGHGHHWVDAVAAMDEDKLAQLGANFLNKTAVQRKSDKPFYIDKLPNNWLYTAFIMLILPNAKIIDARRHPLDCCFSNFRQHFAKGQPFSYDLETIGQYYSDYVRMMAHIDAVQPGRVHRVIHEALVDDPEAEVRSMLAYLGQPFEPECLSFYKNDRAVRTASSEQVRKPINRDGMQQWKPYEQWLNPMKNALGDLLTSYPEFPSG
ncbi:MAG: sulfotransferase [Sphingomonadales bacterium]|nr:sulfotransferase [Sphingomonadales bacterium]